MGTWSSEESAHVLQHSSHRKCSQHPHPVSLAAIRRPASLGEPASGLFVAIAHTAASNVFFPGRVVFELGLVVTNGPSTVACVFDFHSLYVGFLPSPVLPGRFCTVGSTRFGPSPHLESRQRCSQTQRTSEPSPAPYPVSERVGPAKIRRPAFRWTGSKSPHFLTRFFVAIVFRSSCKQGYVVK